MEIERVTDIFKVLNCPSYTIYQVFTTFPMDSRVYKCTFICLISKGEFVESIKKRNDKKTNINLNRNILLDMFCLY